VLLEWFRQEQALNIPSQGPVLRQKANEKALKLNIELTPLNGWLDKFGKYVGLRCRTMKCN
jgi:hypothetical protein